MDITRKQIGKPNKDNIYDKKFEYYRNGVKVIDENILKRIKKNCVPPAWTDVKISNSDTDYLQVIGHDSKDRKQYKYHPVFTELSKIEKYNRLKLFIEKLPLLINIVDKKLNGPIHLNDKEYILALLFKILRNTHSRIGNDVYADENGTYGLTTLLKKHIEIDGDTIKLSYVGKKNVKQNLVFNDKISSKVLKELLKLSGDRVFKTSDGTCIRSTDMNNYLKHVMGCECSVKDFRTYSSNTIFLKNLLRNELPTSEIHAKKIINECYEETAIKLGHTSAISKGSYVMPDIAKKYLEDPIKFMRSKYTLNDFFN